MKTLTKKTMKKKIEIKEIKLGLLTELVVKAWLTF